VKVKKTTWKQSSSHTYNGYMGDILVCYATTWGEGWVIYQVIRSGVQHYMPHAFSSLADAKEWWEMVGAREALSAFIDFNEGKEI